MDVGDIRNLMRKTQACILRNGFLTKHADDLQDVSTFILHMMHKNVRFCVLALWWKWIIWLLESRKKVSEDAPAVNLFFVCCLCLNSC